MAANSSRESSDEKGKKRPFEDVSETEKGNVVYIKLKFHSNTGFWYEGTDGDAEVELDRLATTGFKYSNKVKLLKNSADVEKTKSKWSPVLSAEKRTFVYYDHSIGGLGLKAAEAIKPGDTICIYGGKQVTKPEKFQTIGNESRAHLLEMEKSGGQGINIDASLFGNEGRMVNHHCDLKHVNVNFDLESFSGQELVVLKATRWASAGKILVACYARTNKSEKHLFGIVKCKCGSYQHSAGETAVKNPLFLPNKKSNGDFTSNRSIHSHNQRGASNKFARVVVKYLN